MPQKSGTFLVLGDCIHIVARLTWVLSWFCRDNYANPNLSSKIRALALDGNSSLHWTLNFPCPGCCTPTRVILRSMGATKSSAAQLTLKVLQHLLWLIARADLSSFKNVSEPLLKPRQFP